MNCVKNGDYVSVNYVGTLDNKVIFDSTQNREPLSFVMGNGSLIPEFEEGVLGMKVGDKKSIYIKAADAYGEYLEEAFIEVGKDEMPEGVSIEVGMTLQLLQDDGNVSLVKVKEIKDDLVVIDTNHPLAGQNLTFDITLVDIKENNN